MPLAPDVPYEIGDQAFGGYVAGLINTQDGNIQPDDDSQQGARYILIVSPNELQTSGLAWAGANGSVAGTRTRWDGLAATAALVADPATDHPAADYCAGLSRPADQGSDWYLPALDELELLYRHFKLTSDNNFTGTFIGGDPFPFQTYASYANGANPSSDPTGAAYTIQNPARSTIPGVSIGSPTLDPPFWSSTEAEPASAWFQYFSGSSAGRQSYTTSLTSAGFAWVRPVRRVLTNKPPNAPIPLSPIGGASVDRSKPIILKAQFSDPDPDDFPSASHWRYRITGSAWTTIAQANPLQSYTIPAGLAGGNYEWQAAYQDREGEPVDLAALTWSSSEFFFAVDPTPGPVLLDPVDGQIIGTSAHRGVISTPSLDESEWTLYGDNDGAIDTATVIAGPVLKTSGDLRSHMFDGLANDTVVWWSVRAKDNGLWSEPVRVRTPVSYTPPPVPVVSLTAVSKSGALVVSVSNPAASGSEPAVVYNDVYVTDPGGSEERRKRFLPPNGSWTYWTPTAGADYATRVRVVAVGDNGTTSSSTVPVENFGGGTVEQTYDIEIGGGTP